MKFDPINFVIAAPLLALAAGALVILLLDLLLPARKAHGYWYVAAAGSVITAGFYLVSLWGLEFKSVTGFGGALVMDSFALVFSLILLLVTFLSVLLSLSRGEEDKSGYLALMLWAAMGMMTMVAAGSLMIIFLGLELLSLALYVKVAFDASPKAREAALKYFVLGSFASSFILFGFALIYGVTGSMDLSRIATVVNDGLVVGGANQSMASSLYYKAGLGLALVGFAFKLALVPFHAWAPDVYEGAPTAVTAFMSVGTKAAAFATMGRFLVAVVPEASQTALLLPLSIMAAASMLLGSTVGIWQSDLKRLMAYSGIAHAGYLIMAIAGLGPEGLSAAAYYLASYAFTSLGIFAIIQMLENEGIEGSSLPALAGLYHQRPALAAAMAVLMFGLAGLPPTGGFIGKFLLAKAAVSASAWIVLIALMVSTGISAYVYLRVIGLLFKPPTERSGRSPDLMAGAQQGGLAGAQEELALTPATVRNGVLVVLAIALIGTIWLGILPGTVTGWLTVGL